MRSPLNLKSWLRGGRKRPIATPPASLTLAELFQHDSSERGRQERDDLPRFQVSAADQLDRRASDPLAGVRLKLREAFTPSQPVADRRMFAGRVGVLSQMIRALEDQRLHLVLYGERGIGKTSLLHVLAEAAREARYIVIYGSCGAATSFDELFRAAAREIPLLYHGGYAPTASEAEAGASLADLIGDERLTPRAFAELCVRLTGTRVLVVLDEFDRAVSADFRRELAELIKILSDRSARVQLVIAGVAADLAELVEHIPSIRRNILPGRVPLMSDSEILQLVANGERACGLNFEPAARDFVVAMAHGSPYFASLVAHHAGLIALDQDRIVVRTEDAARAVDQALEEFRERIPRPAQAQVAKVLADGAASSLTIIAGATLSAGGVLDVQDLERRGLKSLDVSRCRRLVDELVSLGILVPLRDEAQSQRYAFSEDGLSAYLWFVSAREQFPSGEARQGASAESRPRSASA